MEMFAIFLFVITIVIWIVSHTSYDKRLDEITTTDRGTQSERKLISSLLDYGISPDSIFHDLYVKNGNHGFSQIDIVVKTRVGIIVFEVKDYSGWIFGRGYQNQWTKVLNYGKQKYHFYNPILQNNSHMRVLQRQSAQMKNIPYYSVIVFYGDCELRDITFVPEGTFVAKAYRVFDVLDTIFDNIDFEYANEQEIIDILKSAVDNGKNAGTQIEHAENVKDMIGADRIFE